MNDWIERNWSSLYDWHIKAPEAQSEDEIAYLFNDIGPLYYAYKSENEDLINIFSK